jgi:hypothetical protein
MTTLNGRPYHPLLHQATQRSAHLAKPVTAALRVSVQLRTCPLSGLVDASTPSNLNIARFLAYEVMYGHAIAMAEYHTEVQTRLEYCLHIYTAVSGVKHIHNHNVINILCCYFNILSFTCEDMTSAHSCNTNSINMSSLYCSLSFVSDISIPNTRYFQLLH